MAISLTMVTTISDKFSKLIKKNYYEPLLCKLLNASSEVFPGNYHLVKDQHSGQCDFVDTQTGEKYDAKLPFRKIHGKLIGSKNHDFKKWIELMLDEETQFGDDIISSRGQNVASLELYKIMAERLETVAEDENAIFFFPYPIVIDGHDSGMISFVSDYLDAIFRTLRKENKVGTRKVFAIYPGYDESIVLRCLNNNTREYFFVPELNEYITYRYSALE